MITVQDDFYYALAFRSWYNSNIYVSVSNKQSFVFLSILVFIRDCARLYEFWALHVYGSVSVLFSNVFKCFSILYPGLSFQLTIARMDISWLCSFIAPYICGALGFVIDVLPFKIYIYCLVAFV